jgi:hypothetical protein
MSLSATEERALTGIEQTLRSRDPRLSSLFSIFTRLTLQEAMPTIEQLRQRRWRPQPDAVLLIAMALVVCALVAGSLASARGCGQALRPTKPSAQSAAITAGASLPQCATHPASVAKGR